ncbi:MAG: diacylglycerol kinase family lipid kinase [Dethiobacter sp.]|nr:diacylglycerol kinase family lipid kinase [Dethiobacter sp.]MBS3901907.1 diacylglycerol kinase family lipid kinase [Dethiobacter sp.]MBS3988821.1 diacylglycerol kinase family lipid kinase [Dethiobacter sp.]
MNSAGFTECGSSMTPTKEPLYFIVNPAANNGRAQETWTALASWLSSEKIPYRVAFSQDGDDIERLSRLAAAEAGAVVAGVGGDGTLSRIADALVGTEAVLGVIPAGTGNDFARSFRIPVSPSEACAVLLQGLTVPLDVGRMNGRMFLNVVGAGLDAAVVVDANRLFKKFAGSLGYFLSLLKQLIFFQPMEMEIRLDSNVFRTKAWFVTVANARYYGSGMKVAPMADPQDGLADVIVVENLHRLRFLSLFPLVYSGRHVGHSAVKLFRSAQITVVSKKPLFVHADGDLYGTTPLTIVMERHAVRLKVPRDKGTGDLSHFNGLG